eukprot:TRINITY_DN98496_c0_g1_i1.p1 TRINITY_DN98496_c0_g1~~TRINITY_DN98496_c0_g1_i1.p1  ORF type:complete len:120 (-),score=39.40 TRINITY_DN98496_c0_g1_i1:81-440(-)
MTKSSYADFRKLSEKEGLDLLLFPCGQFGGQELKTDAEILAFVEEQGLGNKPNVHVMSKGDIIGVDAQPAWKLFKKETQAASDPGWNFAGKFIISKSGEIKEVPRGADVEAMVDELLAE